MMELKYPVVGRSGIMGKLVFIIHVGTVAFNSLLKYSWVARVIDIYIA